MRYTALILLLLLPVLAKAQLHESVLPDLEGQALLNALQDEYRPTTVIPYSFVRDTLFRNIDARNDTLYCIYTEYPVYLTPGVDPTAAAFQSGQGINTEHSYPRSKGAGGFVPESDMHHLFPARVNVNADRASFPYAEVPDNQAVSWYYDDEVFNTQPASDMGQFSELGIFEFEPPSAYKGDIARAIFYFYTMYRQEADLEDPNFFEAQRSTLCEWQAQDPVDQREWDRTKAIAGYQEGKENPFVLDCTLATRCYCEGEVEPCTPPVNSRSLSAIRLELSAFPVPTASQVRLAYTLPAAGQLTIVLHNSLGQEIDSWSLGQQVAGSHQFDVQLPEVAGQYSCSLRWEGRDGRLAVGQVRLLKF
jgi:hypothetical protein